MMLNLNNLNNNPAKSVSWNEPIEMLYACHGKIKRFCGQLTQLPDYLEKNGNNQIVHDSIKQIINYFTIAAPLHHLDEEEDFFPLLIQYYPQAQEMINQLEFEHDNLEFHWQNLSKQLHLLINQEINFINPELIQGLVNGYAKHIELEEPLFELGKKYIPINQLQAIGEIMAQRRKS